MANNQSGNNGVKLGQGWAGGNKIDTGNGGRDNQTDERLIDNEGDVEIPEVRDSRSRRMGDLSNRERNFGSSSRRHDRREGKGERSYIDQGRRRILGQSISRHTEILSKAFQAILDQEIDRASPEAEELKIHVLTRDAFSIPYDTVVLSKIVRIGPASAKVAHFFPFVIAASRGELEKIYFDNRSFALPNVCGDTPDDNNRTIDLIQDTIIENSQKLFKTDDAVDCGQRVIEATAEIHPDDTQQFAILLSDAAEAIMTRIENAIDPDDAFDWTNVATGEDGYGVTNTIDYRPDPMKSATGMPIHRQLVLRTSGYETSFEKNSVAETRIISELSAFVDFRYGVPDRDDDPCWLPVAVLTDFSTEAGGNLVQLLMIGIGNLAQLKEDLQILPALDWRKKDPRNDISMFGFVEPELFDLEKPEAVPISSIEDFYRVGGKALIENLEIAIDVSNADRQSWLAGVLGGAVTRNSADYDVIIAAANAVTGGGFGDLFFEGDIEDLDVVIDSDNFQIGGYYMGPEHERRDVREIGHLAVIAHAPKDLKLLEEYDDSTIGGSDIPARSLYAQLKIKEEIVSRVVVTSYIRRYTFGPWFIHCLLEALRSVGLVAPLDGAIQSPRERRRRMDELASRGISSRKSTRRHVERRRF